MDSHGLSLITAVVDGVCSIWRRKLPSNLLSRAYIKQILTPRPEPLLWAKERGCIYGLFICTEQEGRVERKVPMLSKTTEVLPALNLTTPLETERRGGSHSIWHVVPSIVPFEILRVGGEAMCRFG